MIQKSRLLFVFLLLSSCSQFVHAARTKVTILVDDSYPPYSYVEQGKLKGIYVELVEAAVESLTDDYRVELVPAPWKRALIKMEEGSAFALLPPYRHLDKRPYIRPYSAPLMVETVVAFCQKHINFSDYIAPSIKQSIALNIGINSGYAIFTEEIAAAVNRNNIKVWENKSTDANVFKLHNKRIDCYLNDRLAILWQFERLQKRYRLDFQNVYEAFKVMTQTAHIGYSNSNNQAYPFKQDFIKRMDNALLSLKSSGHYQQIIEEYINKKLLSNKYTP